MAKSTPDPSMLQGVAPVASQALRILILGSSGAGKTTFARQLGALLDVEVIHLDSYFWLPDWEPTRLPDWEQKLAALLKKDSWVMDGNYPQSLELRLSYANRVILLDIPRSVCLFRCGKRLLQHWGRSRVELAPGCREKMDLDFFLWIWRYPQVVRPVIMRHLAKLPAEKEVVILKSTSEAAKYLQNMELLVRNRPFNMSD